MFSVNKEHISSWLFLSSLCYFAYLTGSCNEIEKYFKSLENNFCYNSLKQTQTLGSKYKPIKTIHYYKQ